MARAARRKDWQSEAAAIFDLLLGANGDVNDMIVAVIEGQTDERISPRYEHASASMRAAGDACQSFVDRFNPGNTKSSDQVRLFAASFALPRMFKAALVNWLIGRVILRGAYEDPEEMEMLGTWRERVNMTFALTGSFYSRFKDASVGAMVEAVEPSKMLEEMFNEVRGFEQALREVIEATLE
jgi:hypothetical protein